MAAEHGPSSRDSAPTAADAEQLIVAIARLGDRAAFVALFERFAPRLKTYLRQLGAEEAVADDLVQDVMLTVWRRAGQFDPKKASASTWIFTIARNRRIDLLRRERRPEYDPSDPLLVPNSDLPADRGLERTQTQALLRAAVGALPPEQAALLRMSYLDDKTHSRIAEELGLPLGTVKSRLRLAMEKLRAMLKDSL
ncbi:MAG: sigma-70 family RNA polymerase sigma factor [Kiloniellales bacterium]